MRTYFIILRFSLHWWISITFLHVATVTASVTTVTAFNSIRDNLDVGVGVGLGVPLLVILFLTTLIFIHKKKFHSVILEEWEIDSNEIDIREEIGQ